MKKPRNTGAAYVERFPEVSAALPGRGLPWLNDMRTSAIERFSALGLPTPKMEAWKYTNLSKLEKTVFQPATPAVDGLDAARLAPYRLDQTASHRLVFVDGMFRPEHSALDGLPAGVRITHLAAAFESDPDGLEQILHGATADDGAALVALNTAFMSDGAFVTIARGAALEAPIHLLFVASSNASAIVSHPRNLIVAEAGSSVTIMESYVGLGSDGYWTNAVTQVVAARDARVRHYKLQDEGPAAFHIATTRVGLASGCAYDNFCLSLGGLLARHEIEAAFNGEGGACRLDGAYLARARQHMDTTTRLDHATPGCSSNEVYRGVLDERAHGVFQGTIKVRPDAQKTDAYMLNENLLLSEQAQVDTKPELEIHADDVKCGHGATAGELDREALFYMRARGVSEELARSLLIEAFVAEPVERVESAAIRAHLMGRVATWLPTIGIDREAA